MSRTPPKRVMTAMVTRRSAEEARKAGHPVHVRDGLPNDFGKRRRKIKKDDNANLRLGLDDNFSEWSMLPNDILVDILRRLNTLQDYFAVRGVCRNWRSVATPSPYTLASQSPLLLVTRSKSDALFDITACRPYSLEFPWTHSRRCAKGYSHGHIITRPVYPYTGPIHLWNLFTRATTILPRNRDDLVRQLILSSRPDAAHCLVVLYGCYQCYVKYLTIGDTRWTVASSPCLTSVKAMMFFQGELLGLTNDLELLAFELKGKSLGVRKLGGGRVDGISDHLTLWLGELDGVLVAVYDHDYDDFQVFKWDSEKKGWEKIRELGDKALFINGWGDALSVSTGFSLRKNCVYDSRCFDGWAEISLEDGSCKDVKIEYPDLYVTPIWVFPNHC